MADSLKGGGPDEEDFKPRDLVFSAIFWVIAIAAVVGLVLWILIGHTPR